MHAELACHALPSPSHLTGTRFGRAGWLTALGLAAAGVLAAGVAAFAWPSTLPWPLPWPDVLDSPLRLGVAAVIGVAVTAVQRRGQRVAHATAMHHAQILLCVAGAMMMVLINDSLARAFGIAGAASLVRFRTPVDDPRDAAVMFLLIGLGMASGLGAFALAAGGAAMVALFLVALSRTGARSRRSLVVDLVACGPAFPGEHVQRVFARHGASLEIRQVWFGDEARATYLATFAADAELDAVHADLVAGGTAGLRAVSWEPARKRLL
jgi:hypothetical protein